MDPKENLIRAITRNDPAYVPYYGGDDRSVYPMQTLSYDGAWARHYRRGRKRWTEELFGVTYESSGEWEGSPAVVGYPMKTVNDLEDFQFPDPSVPDRFEQVRKEIDKEDVLTAGGHPACLFHRAWTLLSMDVFFLEIALYPDKIKELLRCISDFQIEMAKQYIAAGVEMGRISDDWGSQEALMISPAMWREFIKPELKRIVDTYKDGGCFVQVHSCGHVEEIVGDLVELGVDVLNPIQARANDLPMLKANYGDRICFAGGVDSHQVLMLGTREDVAEATKDAIRVMGPGGGYIVGPDQGMPFPQENIQALLDAAREYGKYPLRI